MSELICAGCGRDFDLGGREPRALPVCGHTFCAECVRGWLATGRAVCPEDGKAFQADAAAGLAAFPLNLALRRLVAERGGQSAEQRLCTEHAKPADLVCVTDSALICADCVLFGAHKSHEYLRAADHVRQTRARAQTAVSELELLGRQSFLADGQRRLEEARQAVEAKKAELGRCVDQHFLALADWLQRQREAFHAALVAKTERLDAAVADFELRLAALVEREQETSRGLEEALARLDASFPDAELLLRSPTADLSTLREELRAAEAAHAELCTTRLNGLAVTADLATVVELLTGNLGLDVLDWEAVGSVRSLRSADSSFLITADGQLSPEPSPVGGARPKPPARPKQLVKLPPKPLLRSTRNITSNESLLGGRRLLSDAKAVAPAGAARLQRTAPRSATSNVSLEPAKVLRFDAPAHGGETVSFANLRITDAKLNNVIADVLRNKRAKTLVLDNNQVTSAGLETLLERLGAHETLQRLSIANNTLDEQALARLAALASKLRTLRSFCFAGNKGIKPSGKTRRLRADLLRCGVTVEL